MLEHLEDDRVALMRELRRVAAPGGRLLATVPAYRWLWSQHDDAHHHFRRYTLAGAARRRLGGQGWEAAEWSYFNTLLLPPIAAVRTARAPPSAGGRPPGPEAHPAGAEPPAARADAASRRR